MLRSWISISKPSMGTGEIRAVEEVLRSGQLVQGPKVRDFEQRFADYVGTKHAVAMSSGTAALQVALIALGVRPGDEVITSPFSFFSSASAILLTGARPVFVDVEGKTYNLDPNALGDSITPKTKVILPVHLHGHPADMDQIMEIAEERGIVVLEDAAQAHGAEYKGKRAGSLGDAAAFSFYASKNMTTGEGGIVTTDDSEVARRASLLRNHGQVERYDHHYVGYNYRMTDIQAAIGIVQLGRLEEFLERRREIAKRYSDELNGVRGLDLPMVEDWAKHSWYLYTIRAVNLDRDDLVNKMRSKQIDARPTYPCPIQRQPAMRMLDDPDRNFLASLFSQVDYSRVETPVASRLAEELFYIPIHSCLTDEQVARVVSAVREVANP